MKRWPNVLWIALVALMIADAASAAGLKILLRYDDYSQSSNTDVEIALFDAVKAVNGAVLVGVIPFPSLPHPSPDAVDSPLAVELDEKKIGVLQRYASDGVIDVAVHGFNHRDITASGPGKPKSEFRGISEREQRHFLGVAKAALEAATGVRVSVFIPPFNSYDALTLIALEQSGYATLSATLSPQLSHASRVNFLPGGPYPQEFRDVVLSALARRHQDALVVATMHPYDFVESGQEMSSFRNGAKPVSIRQFADDLLYVQKLAQVQFVHGHDFVEQVGSLSSSRAEANLKLRENFVARHRLLPDALNMYALDGLYYEENSAFHMLLGQIAAAVALYGMLMIGWLFLTVNILGRVAVLRSFSLLIGGASTAVVIVLLVKASITGFYMSSAAGIACFIGILLGVGRSRWLTMK